ncbi:MAG TPA: glycosyltransferase family 4 protein [Thermoanaerobaculia bacterium]|nr:glycosyltransferase family 4 protein [Thermoanaerobaculia bacterium]
MRRRIALVVPAFPKTSETFIVNKVLGLLELGWDVHVVCGRSDPAEWERFSQLPRTAEMRRRVHVGWPHRPSWRAAALAPVAAASCLGAAPARTLRFVGRGSRRYGAGGTLRRLYVEADLVSLAPEIVHFEFGALAPARMYLRDLLGCRIVVSFRGYDLNFVGLDRPGHYDPVWDTADGLHFLGEDLRRRGLRRGCPPERLHALIPPAIDAAFFRPEPREWTAPSEARPLRILSVGRLEWKKGYENALLAVRSLRGEGLPFQYRIAGDGDYLGAIAFARYRLKLEDTVHLLGGLARDEIRREMQNADVLLHAATSEGFCNAVIEAQAMELPVVCTDADGLSENVADGETGFVVPRRNNLALTAKLSALARDPELRRRMGEAGRRRVLAHFQLADQVAAFDRFYRAVLDAPASLRAADARGNAARADEDATLASLVEEHRPAIQAAGGDEP